MEVIRRTMKITLFGILLFIVLSIPAAIVMYCSALKEEWFTYIMYGILVLISLLVAVLESKIVSRRGLVAGIVAAVLFPVFMLAVIKLIFP